MEKIKACIFDLDGVIVDTAKYHFAAWRRMANELGFDFTKKENEKLKGVSRIDSLNLILSWGGIELTAEEKAKFAFQKNEWYLEYVSKMDNSEILEGVLPFLNELKSKDIKIALGSASKNAPTIINRVGLEKYFDALIDGNQVEKGKPNPEVFYKGAKAIGVEPRESIVFEDAPKGIEAALAGNFWAVGIGAKEDLGNAHLVIPSFVNWTLDKIIEQVIR